jgi:hypothetical protein
VSEVEWMPEGIVGVTEGPTVTGAVTNSAAVA